MRDSEQERNKKARIIGEERAPAEKKMPLSLLFRDTYEASRQLKYLTRILLDNLSADEEALPLAQVVHDLASRQYDLLFEFHHIMGPYTILDRLPKDA